MRVQNRIINNKRLISLINLFMAQRMKENVTSQLSKCFVLLKNLEQGLGMMKSQKILFTHRELI